MLNDHWQDMAEEGFLSNRVFDVAMAGGFVISDTVAGAEVFEGLLSMFDTPEELLPPRHRLLLAHTFEGTLVGCGSLRRIRDDAAEMKG